jgi:hypothetical protein
MGDYTPNRPNLPVPDKKDDVAVVTAVLVDL